MTLLNFTIEGKTPSEKERLNSLDNWFEIVLLSKQCQDFCCHFRFDQPKRKFLIINHLFFIFKFYTYNSRSSGKLNIEYLKTIICKTENIEFRHIILDLVAN